MGPQSFRPDTLLETLTRLEWSALHIQEASKRCDALRYDIEVRLLMARDIVTRLSPMPGDSGGVTGNDATAGSRTTPSYTSDNLRVAWEDAGLAESVATCRRLMAELDHLRRQLLATLDRWKESVNAVPRLRLAEAYESMYLTVDSDFHSAMDALSHLSLLLHAENLSQLLLDPQSAGAALAAAALQLAESSMRVDVEIRSAAARVHAFVAALSTDSSATDSSGVAVRTGSEPTTEQVTPVAQRDNQPPIGPRAPVFIRAFYPRVAMTQRWHTLLAYLHVETALAAVRADARRFSDELGQTVGESSLGVSHDLPRGVTITIVPRLANVNFNPPAASFIWTEDWHRMSFRFHAPLGLAGSAQNGEITVYAALGEASAYIAAVRLAVVFEEGPGEHMPSLEGGAPHVSEASATLYKSVFMSYAHEDEPIVNECAAIYDVLGITLNLDKRALRSGQFFEPALMRLIEQSDVFQLFWSQHASASSFVRKEWEHALQCGRGEGFIRPLYWDEPMANPPLELASLHFSRLKRATLGDVGGW